jgi:hypothetical protein
VFIGLAIDKRSGSGLFAPHRKKAARALRRTAFHTTADCAVPPIYLTFNQ